MLTLMYTVMFQSLFLWNALVELGDCEATVHDLRFQSLFLWNALVELHGPYARIHPATVSILVFMECARRDA